MVADTLLAASKDGVLIDSRGRQMNGGVQKNVHRVVRRNGKLRRVDELILEQADMPRPGPGYRPVQLDGDFSNCKLDNLRWMTDSERRAHMSTARPIRMRNKNSSRAIVAWSMDDPSNRETFPSIQEARRVLEARLGKPVNAGSISRMCNKDKYTKQVAGYAFEFAPDDRNDNPAEDLECTLSEDSRDDVRRRKSNATQQGFAIEATCVADGTTRTFVSTKAAAVGLSTNEIKIAATTIGTRINPESSTYGAPYKGYVFKRHDTVQ